jgi:hypothetical protein
MTGVSSSRVFLALLVAVTTGWAEEPAGELPIVLVSQKGPDGGAGASLIFLDPDTLESRGALTVGANPSVVTGPRRALCVVAGPKKGPISLAIVDPLGMRREVELELPARPLATGFSSDESQLFFVVETDEGTVIRAVSIPSGEVDEAPIGQSEERLSTRTRFFLSGALPFELDDLYQLRAAKFDEVFELERSVLLPRGSGSARALAPEAGSEAWRLISIDDDGSAPRRSAPLGGAVYGAGGVTGSDRLYVVVKAEGEASLVVIDGLQIRQSIDLPAVALPIAEGRTADELILSRGSALLVVDTSAGKVVHDIVVAGEVSGIAVDVARGRAYLGRENSGFISIVDLARGKIIDEFKRGRTAARSGRSPAKYTAVRSDAATILSSSTIIGAGSQANEGEILLGEGGRFVYVLTKEARDVTVYDAEAKQVVAHIPTGAGPTHLVRGTPGSRMYAVASDRVNLINAETNETIEQYRANRSEWSFRPFLVVDHTHGLLFAFGKKTLEAIWAEDGRTHSLTAHRPDDVLLLGVQCAQRRCRF